jgi:hypothetical protein
MPAVKVARVPSFGPPPDVIRSAPVTGPNTGATTVGPFPIGGLPLGNSATGTKRTITAVQLYPSVDVALNADACTFTLETAAGAAIATGTNAAAFTKAAGLSMTLTSAAVGIARGTPLFVKAVNVASGTDLRGVSFIFQVEHQPA